LYGAESYLGKKKLHKRQSQNAAVTLNFEINRNLKLQVEFANNSKKHNTLQHTQWRNSHWTINVQAGDSYLYKLIAPIYTKIGQQLFGEKSRQSWHVQQTMR